MTTPNHNPTKTMKYENGSHEYHVSPRAITVIRHGSDRPTHGLYEIPELGISAGAININGRPVALQGKLYLSPEVVEHIPNAHADGVIRFK